LLVQQLSEFPLGFDDGPDSLEMAVRQALELKNGVGTRFSDGLGSRLAIGA
jgi:hypothetical protein